MTHWLVYLGIVVSSVAATKFYDKLLDPIVDDLYHGLRIRMGRHGVKVRPSQRSNDVTVPRGFTNSVPGLTVIKVPFQLYNKGLTDITIEKIDGALEKSSGELPPHIRLTEMEQIADPILGQHKTATLTATVTIDYPIMGPEPFNEKVDGFLKYLVAMGKEMSIAVNVKYTHRDKDFVTVQSIDASVQKTMAEMWSGFLRGQDYPNTEVHEKVQEILTELQKLY